MRKTFVETREFTEWVKGYLTDESAENWSHAMEFNRFDVSAKELVWDDPHAWLVRFGIGLRGPIEVIDSDITTLSASADKVVKVGGPDPYLVNIELHSESDQAIWCTLDRDKRWDVLDLTGYPSTGGLSSVVSAWVMTCAAVWPLDERGVHQQRRIQGMSRPRRWQRSSAA